jgi:murein DD-endopeptidase MepM/ murein hydrolase activator NlpD
MRQIGEIRYALHRDDPNAPTTSYTVAAGDTLSSIASRLEVTYEQLVNLNPTLLNGGLQAGHTLTVPTTQPFMPVKNIRTIIFPEEFPFDIDEIETIAYVRGFRNIATAGRPGVREVTAEVAEVNGVEISREIQSTRILSAPVTQRVIVGTNNPANIESFGPVSSRGFLWPTQGGVITVGLGGYPGHTGVDIPRPAGTPIFAAAAGTVVRTVHSRVGYGLHVVIDHHNGYTTLYAHASAIHVSVGQRVNQGDVIASVGRTGNSTGNHLHFEVRRNGRIMDPAHYLQR